MRDRFTRVLKGHIAVARAVFPAGTNGAQIDALARASLWRAGLDFDHGTGHGIGSYLSVHEGPQRLSKTGTTALLPGMIISNEPGYYAAGAFGIRIENLLAVEERKIPGGERPMLGFETLTFAPIDLTLVDPETHGRRRNRLAQRLSRTRAQDLVAAGRRPDPPMACEGDAPPGRGQALTSRLERGGATRKHETPAAVMPATSASSEVLIRAVRNQPHAGPISCPRKRASSKTLIELSITACAGMTIRPTAIRSEGALR